MSRRTAVVACCVTAVVVLVIGLLVWLGRSDDDRDVVDAADGTTTTLHRLRSTSSRAAAESTTSTLDAVPTTSSTLRAPTTTTRPCAPPYLATESHSPFDPSGNYQNLDGVERFLDAWPLPSDDWKDPHLPDVRLLHDGNEPARWAAGDLDGDGHLEVFVVGQNEGWLVSGDTPPGTYEVDDVGTRMPDRFYATVIGLNRVGDVNDDGFDDVMMTSGDDHIVYSGQHLLDPGPGGTLEAYPEPLETVHAPSNPPGPYVPAWVLPDGLEHAAVPVTTEPSHDDVVFTLLTPTKVALRTGSHFEDDPNASGGNATGFNARSASVSLVRRHQHRQLLGYMNNTLWVWDLDHLC